MAETSKPTLRRLYLFDAVMQTNSVGAAASNVGLSQPAVTHALNKLEHEVGLRLFERIRSGSYPTRAGRILHRRVERVLKQVQAGIQGARAAAGSDDLDVSPRGITTPQVRAHLAIVEGGSFRNAAERLSLAQPTLQRAARELEQVVGARLYRRTSQGLSANPAGVSLANHMRLALYEVDQALDELEAEGGAGGGRVSAGCLPLMPKPVLARTVGALLRRYPNVRVELKEAPYEVLLDELRSGELDIVVGALRDPRLGGEVVERALFNDPHVVVVRAGHPLAQAGQVSEPDLARFPWVAPSQNLPRRAFVDALFARLPQKPRIVAETSSLAIMTAILMESDCVTLMSRAQAAQEFRHAGVSILPVEFEAVDRTVGVTTRRGWLPTIVQRQFLTLLRQECR